MTISNDLLFVPFQLANAAAVIYTMPTSPVTTVLKNGRVRLTNTTAANHTATLHADVAGTATGAVNMFLDTYAINAHTSLEVDLPTMKAGWTLRGFADAAASITVHEMSGTLWS